MCSLCPATKIVHPCSPPPQYELSELISLRIMYLWDVSKAAYPRVHAVVLKLNVLEGNGPKRVAGQGGFWRLCCDCTYVEPLHDVENLHEWIVHSRARCCSNNTCTLAKRTSSALLLGVFTYRFRIPSKPGTTKRTFSYFTSAVSMRVKHEEPLQPAAICEYFECHIGTFH